MTQNYEKKNKQIRKRFYELLEKHPDSFTKRLKFSWSNWGFGFEPLKDSFHRLHQADIRYIELHGNHYGKDLGYRVKETKQLLESYDMSVSGVCGMFSAENDLSSNAPGKRQAAIDYLKREIEFTKEVGGHYLLVVPGAVGRPQAYDDMELERSADSLLTVADLFQEYEIKAAVEPVRAAEVSFVHTVAEARHYIRKVNHKGVQHINGDVYHMQSEEAHIGEAILEAEDHLVNLHMADSNRGALGDGHMDIDTIIMALYLIDFHQKAAFVTPEPLGPGGDPYPAMHAKPDQEKLNYLVQQSVSYFREREEYLLNGGYTKNQ
ncbi:sugar phosphate isomerase/epimerase family protein [Salibacterium aidingense]|uniref:sugar phosphate isomerase/epimerase family protein n=1 Tax=Salibacterium aidingense TaxID=384933 RepID=UPI003BE69FE6